jgi:hypothetical protein
VLKNMIWMVHQTSSSPRVERKGFHSQGKKLAFWRKKMLGPAWFLANEIGCSFKQSGPQLGCTGLQPSTPVALPAALNPRRPTPCSANQPECPVDRGETMRGAGLPGFHQVLNRSWPSRASVKLSD